MGERKKVDCSVPWRIESTGELVQGLFFIIDLARLLLKVGTEGCAAGKWRGLLETNPLVVFCKGVSGVV